MQPTYSVVTVNCVDLPLCPETNATAATADATAGATTDAATDAPTDATADATANATAGGFLDATWDFVVHTSNVLSGHCCLFIKFHYFFFDTKEQADLSKIFQDPVVAAGDCGHEGYRNNKTETNLFFFSVAGW